MYIKDEYACEKCKAIVMLEEVKNLLETQAIGKEDIPEKIRKEICRYLKDR